MGKYEYLYRMLYRCVVEAYSCLENGEVGAGMKILANAMLLTMLRDENPALFSHEWE